MGVHYPTDVIGGFALGTAVALLLAPLAQALAVPLTTAIGRSKAAWLVRAPGVGRRRGAGRRGQPGGGRGIGEPRGAQGDKDLAA